MNILGHKITMVDGPGIRFGIWVAGCTHHCMGCQNQYSWNSNAGYQMDKDEYYHIIQIINKRQNVLDGITFSGGDPLHPYNRKVVLQMCMDFKKMFPSLNIWIYTGYTMEEILKNESIYECIKYADTIVDGRYMDDLDPIIYRGSNNQRLIDVAEIIRLHNKA